MLTGTRRSSRRAGRTPTNASNSIRRCVRTTRLSGAFSFPTRSTFGMWAISAWMSSGRTHRRSIAALFIPIPVEPPRDVRTNGATLDGGGVGTHRRRASLRAFHRRHAAGAARSRRVGPRRRNARHRGCTARAPGLTAQDCCAIASPTTRRHPPRLRERYPADLLKTVQTIRIIKTIQTIQTHKTIQSIKTRKPVVLSKLLANTRIELNPAAMLG